MLAFEEVLQFNKVDIFLKSNESIPGELAGQLLTILEQLKQEKPIQYILGKCVFYGLPLRLSDAVLVPRPETEELVHWIVKGTKKSGLSVIDLGTGSGCIALSLKDHMEHSQVFAVDNSVGALNIAKENAKRNNLNIDFFHFDLLEQESLGFMQFDVMVSNPPYVRNSEMMVMDKNVLNYEPHSALFVDDDEPLLFYRKIIDLAEGHLKKHGQLYFEINEAFGIQTVQLLKDRGFEKVELKKDFNGKDRMIRATRH